MHSTESTKEGKGFKEDDFSLERNDARIVKWMHHDKPEIEFPLKNLQTTRLKLNSMRECFQNRGIQLSGHLKRVFGLVNVEPSRLVVVYAEDNLQKYKVAQSEKDLSFNLFQFLSILKERKVSQT